MRRSILLILGAALTFSAPLSAIADGIVKGVAKEAIDHPIITGAVIGSAIYLHHKAKCEKLQAQSADGVFTEEAATSGCSNKVSLKDKAKLLLLKSQTKELRKNLAANGEEEKKGCAAHHIVPKNEGREWAKKDADDARSVLDSCGISIDDAINGVYLPYNNDAECVGANHRKLHTSKYYKAIGALLGKASVNGCSRLRDQMQNIKNELQRNTFIGGVW